MKWCSQESWSWANRECVPGNGIALELNTSTFNNRKHLFQIDNNKFIATVNRLYSSYEHHNSNMGENIDSEAFSKANILSLLQSILMSQQNIRPSAPSIIKIAEPGKFSG